MSKKVLPLAISLILIIAASFLLAAPVTSASDSSAVWSKTYGGSGSDRAAAMIRTQEGGYAMIGTTNSYGSGLISAWLVKTDVDGNILWNQTYSGLGQGIADALVQLSDNGYAATGYTYSLDESGAGILSMWILRTDYLGNLLWNRTYAEVGTSIGYFIIQTSDGGLAIVGTSNSLTMGAKTGWLLKTNGNGDVEWSKIFNASSTDEVYSVIQTGDGGYAVAGNTITGITSNSTLSSFWLIKTDSEGVMQWNQTYNLSASSVLSTMVQTGDGGYALTGAIQETSGDKFLIVKTDSSGNMQWYKSYSPAGSSDAYSGIQTSDGGYAILGAEGETGNSFYKVLLIKAASDGTLQWNQTYGGSAVSVAGAIVQIPDGNYVLGGYTNSTGAGSEDFWLMKVDSSGNSALPTASAAPTPSGSGVSASPTSTDDGSQGGGFTWNFTTTIAAGAAILVVIIIVGFLALRRQSSKSRYRKRR